MPDYTDVYFKRLNRYGLNLQSRRLNERKAEFDNYLLKSSYRIELNYNGEYHPASFERRKQDDTDTTYYLLTHCDVEIPNGEILWIPSASNVLRPWMVWYIEDQQVRAYNRYIMLKMTHHIKWRNSEKDEWHESLCHMYGQEDNMLKNEARSRSRKDTLYSENLKLSFAVMPRNPYLKKDGLVLVGEEPYLEEYRITGWDMQSTLGVAYVSMDPTYDHDLTAAPQQKVDTVEEDNNFFWLNGGIK